eukprot:5280754-Prorocentrum_lima.AAC.1
MLQQLRGFLGEKRHRREQRNARGASQLKNGAVESQGLVTSGGAAVIPVSLTMKGLGVAAGIVTFRPRTEYRLVAAENIYKVLQLPPG